MLVEIELALLFIYLDFSIDFKILSGYTDDVKTQNIVHTIQSICLLFFSFLTEEHHQQINFVEFHLTFRKMIAK